MHTGGGAAARVESRAQRLGPDGDLMRHASIIERIGGDKGIDAWAVHSRGKERRAAGEDVIVLSIGEPDFETPPAIVEAAVDALREGRTRYTSAGGIRALREEIAGFHRSMTGQTVQPDEVVVLPGAQCGLYAALMCLTERGDEVLCCDPCYITYEATIGASGAGMRSMPLRPENAFQVDPAELAAALTPATRAILVNSPHNPTGSVLSRESLEALAAVCRARDVWLISDEVYATLVFDQPHLSPAALPGMHDRTVTVSSFSKSHAMTGWRLGWAVAPLDIARHMEELASCMLYGSPEFIQLAALHGLREHPEEVQVMADAYRHRRDLVCGALKGMPGIRCHVPAGGMYVMPDVRGTGLTGEEFAWRLLDEYGVAVQPGEPFGSQAAGHVRISFASSDQELAEACARIGRFVRGLVGEGDAERPAGVGI